MPVAHSLKRRQAESFPVLLGDPYCSWKQIGFWLGSGTVDLHLGVLAAVTSEILLKDMLHKLLML